MGEVELGKYKSVKVKKLYKKKYRYCLDCDWEESDWSLEHPVLHKDNKIDVERAKEYCDNHVTIYDHKSCTPDWCDGCGNLKKYVVIV
tara:strand:+ start:1375 stop:1638 length:264 start_codon:yes stop_codon:yes gene_type:complete